MSIDVVEVVIWRESSVSGGSGAVQMFLRWQDRKSGSAGMPRSEERFSRNAETDFVCRRLLEKKKLAKIADDGHQPGDDPPTALDRLQFRALQSLSFLSSEISHIV